MPDQLFNDQQPWQNYVLLDCFASYYAEIVRVKEAIASATLPTYLARGGQVRPNDIVETSAMLSGRLRDRLEAQARALQDNWSKAEGGRETQGGRLSRAHRLACYVMAALTDELLILDVQWEGKEVWLNFLLEQKLFGTSRAGRDFFDHAERLLGTTIKDTLYADLASVFLIALHLGFQGRYRGEHGDGSLQKLRLRLQRFIASCNPERPKEDRYLFPQAYAKPISFAEQARLAPMGRWYRLAALALGAYLLISTAVWMIAVAPLTQ